MDSTSELTGLGLTACQCASMPPPSTICKAPEHAHEFFLDFPGRATPQNKQHVIDFEAILLIFSFLVYAFIPSCLVVSSLTTHAMANAITYI